MTQNTFSDDISHSDTIATTCFKILFNTALNIQGYISTVIPLKYIPNLKTEILSKQLYVAEHLHSLLISLPSIENG